MAESKQKQVHLGTGRRKTAVARVRLFEGSGKFIINDRAIDDYFTEDRDRSLVIAPLETCEMRNKLDVQVNVCGGGFTGQAGAICQGVARALKDMFGLTTTEAPPAEEGAEGAEGAEESPTSALAKKLRDSGYLTRDGRMKERKKYGRKAARKSFQFSKR
ncbi:MAG: 30S ribosomal protein S9 [Gemmataceae bacterium]